MTAVDADVWYRGGLDMLATNFPAHFQSGTASAVGDTVQAVKTTITDIVNTHLGEMREIDGGWVPLETALCSARLAVSSIPSPTVEFWAPLFNQQFALQGWDRAGAETAAAKDDEGNINLVLKLAGPAGKLKGQVGSAIGDYLVREGKVISVGEACWMFGHEYTAAELYQYFQNARRLTTKRAHSWTGAERREGVIQHKGATGRWGLGKGSAIGDVAWQGQVSVAR